MTAWLLLDEVEILFYTGKENVPLDRQVRTIAHRNSVSVEMAAQAASITADIPQKHSPCYVEEREGQGVTQGGDAPAWACLPPRRSTISVVVVRLSCDLRLDRSTRSRVPVGADCRKEAKGESDAS